VIYFPLGPVTEQLDDKQFAAASDGSKLSPSVYMAVYRNRHHGETDALTSIVTRWWSDVYHLLPKSV